MGVSTATWQVATVVLLLVVDVYRVLVSSFLAIVVPQTCPGWEDGSGVPHDCSLLEQVTDLTTFNTVALCLNGATAGVMLVAFANEYVRERWLIRHFIADENAPLDALRADIEAHAVLKRKLAWFNVRYILLMALATGMQITNIAVSGVLIFSDYPDGLKSWTTFVTSVLVIASRLYYSLAVAYMSHVGGKAQSVSLTEPLTFNTVNAAVPDGRDGSAWFPPVSVGATVRAILVPPDIRKRVPATATAPAVVGGSTPIQL